MSVRPADLLNPVIRGSKITEDGVKGNVSAALSYCAAWVSGNGCVPINHLMEDAATAEIARMQLWQWVYHGAIMVCLHVLPHHLHSTHPPPFLPRITDHP